METIYKMSSFDFDEFFLVCTIWNLYDDSSNAEFAWF